ncbi:MAG: RagB/SusD family nutrient uptake outer membrane protein [Rikenellaceae bacterium]
MKNKYIILAIAAVALLAVSCIKDFDQDNPNNSQRDITSLNDCQYLLTATYNALYNQDIWSFEESENSSDMAHPGSQRFGTITDQTIAAYYFKNYSNSASGIQKRYSALYIGVYRANQVIEALDSLIEDGITTEESDDWAFKMAQARTLRGMFHFFLHSLFNQGDVVMFDHVPSDIESLTVPLSASADVIAFFRSDFEWAIENWPTGIEKIDGELTMPVAQTLLGTSYLYEGEWEKCKELLTDVIDNDAYSLIRSDNMQDLFGTSCEFNNESIFEINYEDGIHTELGTAVNNTVNSIYLLSRTDFSYPAWLVVAYQNEVINTKDPRNIVLDRDGIFQYKTRHANGYPLYDINSSTQPHDPSLIPVTLDPDLARYRTLSMRAGATSMIAMDDDFPYYVDQGYTSNCYSIGTVGIGYSRKYLNWDIYESESDMINGKSNSGRNVQVLRLAGVYLMYAEANIELDNIPEALKYLNRIRDRWGLQLLGRSTESGVEYNTTTNDFDNIEYTQETLRKRLQDYERPLELSQEGFSTRLIDLRRWGIAKERYDDLASRDYVLTRFGYDGSGYDTTGEPEVTKSAMILEVDETISAQVLADSGDIFNDFVEASKNYTENNDYWPIPLAEIQNNPSLEENGVEIHY